MTQPSPYNRATNFSAFQAGNPTAPLPAGPLDEEFSRIKVVIDQIRSVIRAIQRDDTALANASVGFDQLKTEIAIGINPPSAWATLTNYVVRDTVFTDSKFYICEISHVSGVFADDLAAGYWEEIASFEAATSAASVTYNNGTSGLAANTVQAAIDEIDGDVDTLSAAVAGLDATQIPYDDTSDVKIDATNVSGALKDLDTAVVQAMPTGAVIDYAGSTAPTGWLLCHGQSLLRADYVPLFAAISTTYGAVDGTHFNVPDLRGRVVAGKDNMGGVSANLLTDQSGGINGDVLGDTGGAETHTLTEAQLAEHDHVVSGTTNSTGAANITVELLTSTAPNANATAGSAAAQGTGAVGANTADVASSIPNHSHTVSGTAANAGSGAAHNNVQPTFILNKIIKT